MDQESSEHLFDNLAQKFCDSSLTEGTKELVRNYCC